MKAIRLTESRIERILDKWIPENLKMGDGRPLKLTSYQREIAETVLGDAFGLGGGSGKYCILAGTRCGKTELVSILAILLALLKGGLEIVIVAPIYRQAIEGIFERIDGYLYRNKKLWKAVRRIQRHNGRIEFKNESKILCLSANNTEGLLGYGGDVIIIDECGSIDRETIKQRILRMVMTKKENSRNLLFVIGTPHRKESYLFDAWNSEDFIKYRITWCDAVKENIMSKDEIEFIRKELSEDEFSVWYGAEWRDLSEDDFFDVSRVRERCIIEKKSYDKESLDGFDEIILGCDVARYGTSKSAIAIVGRLGENYYLIDYRTVSKKGLTWQMGWIENTAKKFKASKIVVDATGLGAGVYDVLKERLEEKGVDVIGFNFSRRRDRYNLYDNLKYQIEEGGLFLLRDERLRQQFNAFKVKYRSDGTKDVIKLRNIESDIVDSLALSLYGFNSGRCSVADFMNIDELIGAGALW